MKLFIESTNRQTQFETRKKEPATWGRRRTTIGRPFRCCADRVDELGGRSDEQRHKVWKKHTVVQLQRMTKNAVLSPSAGAGTLEGTRALGGFESTFVFFLEQMMGLKLKVPCIDEMKNRNSHIN
jgi:hypothetical protein